MSDQEAEPRGRYFEEFAEGYTITTPARTITEADVVNFAAFSGDWNPLHTNAEYASETPFKARIAHGLLGLAVASGLGARLGFLDGTAEAFLKLEWKFRKPIYLGDTIHLRGEVTRTRAVRSMGGGIVVFDMKLLNQEGGAVQEGKWTVAIRGQPEESES
ncbi:MAG: MaoC/PaaZ C-terminal domain-containing protein [Chloroflexota bacterium]|nr:MaoC/PaaZ C-terminal domain-containing protein [Chloroflexota bacterium]